METKKFEVCVCLFVLYCFFREVAKFNLSNQILMGNSCLLSEHTETTFRPPTTHGDIPLEGFEIQFSLTNVA